MALAIGTRTRRLLIALAVSSATACNDGTGINPAEVRFLVVQGDAGSGPRLIDYEAPRLRERRSMPMLTADSGMDVLLGDGSGGFYARRFAGTSALAQEWNLVRYDAAWHVVASRSAAELVGTMSLTSLPYLRFTPDRQYVVLAVNSLQTSQTLLVLDAVTLAIANRTGRPLPQFPASAPTAATGSDVLLALDTGECPVPLVWLVVATGVTADSTVMPCDYALSGALTHRQVYRRGPQSGVPRFELFDVTTGEVLATADPITPAYDAIGLATHGHLVYFESGNAAALDAQTLTLLGRVGTGPDVAIPRTVTQGIVDPSTGSVIGVSATRTSCVACLPTPDGIVIIDADNLTVILDRVLGVPLRLVP